MLFNRTSNRIIFGVLLWLVSNNCLKAQIEDGPPRSVNANTSIIPPSPTVAALGKYGSVPVGLFSGTVKVNVPIYQIKTRHLSVPISLNYHGSGIRVTESASWVGLGFSLDVGGVVTRTVRGLPDDDNNGYLAHQSQIEALPALANGTSSNPLYAAIATGIRDGEPDQYHFNFGGRAGQLVFLANGRIVAAPYQKLIVDYLRDATNKKIGFTIVNEDGTKYLFGQNNAHEESINTSESPVSDYIQTWFLTEIVSQDGSDHIYFDYSASHRVAYRSRYSETLSILDYYKKGGGGGESTVPTAEKSIDRSQTVVNAKKLHKIRFADGEVIFTASDRTDLEEDKKLDQITIQQPGKILKRFLFSYDYFKSTPYKNALQSTRLQLKTLTECDGSQVCKPPHQFTYYNDQILPNLDSFAEDHYGFYNGKSNNTLIPEGLYTRLSYQGADREPTEDIEIAQTGLLRVIIYPTKGSTEFFYEPNYYYDGDGKVRSKDPINVDAAASSNSTPSRNPHQDIVQVQSFTIEPRTDLPFGGNSEVRLNYDFWRCCNNNVTTSENRGRIRLVKKGTPDVVVWNRMHNFNQANQSNPSPILLSLAPGNYELVATVTYEGFWPSGLTFVSSASLSYYTYAYPSVYQRPAGGVRIRKIVDHNGSDPSQDQVRSFTYSSPEIIHGTQALRSNGIISSQPIYSYNHVILTPSHPPMMCLADEFRFVKLFSSSQTALGTIQGNHVTYSKATEYFGNDGENGKKEYVYTPGQTMQYGFPFAPVPNTDYKYGLLKEATTYRKKADGTYQMVHKLTNDYQINDEEGSPNRTWMGGIKVQYNAKGQNQSECNASRYNAVKYQVLSEWYYLKRTQEITYDNDDATGPSSVLSTTYHYDNPQHIQLTRTKTVTSLEDTLLTRLTYPLDYTIASPTGVPSIALKAMQSQHIVSPVVEKQTWRKRSATDSTLVAAELTHYKSLSSGNVVPDTLLSLQVAQPLTLNTTATQTPNSFSPLRVNASGALVREGKYESRVQYEQYDAKGNIQQVRRADDIPTSLIWGYNSTYPIAEIKNATYAEVVAVLGQAVIDELAGASPGTDAEVRQKLAPLRTDARLQKAQVSILTYRPLVGMTSATDAAGKTNYYEYDELQRLRRVKDQEGSIVKQNIYHYKGQP